MNHTKTYCKIDAETISCYRTNYQPEYWQSVANKVGNQCAAPVGAVLAVNALCDEVERLHKQRDELLSICEELRESAEYWSEYDVPLGIVERLTAAIASVKELK